MNATEKTGATASATVSQFLPLRSAKIQSDHLEKLAIVYVRQSSPQQVLENRESTARQYALAQYAEFLGLPSERVLVIDEDQGQSGKTAENRHCCPIQGDRASATSPDLPTSDLLPNQVAARQVPRQLVLQKTYPGPCWPR
jgi:hypothetical protein